MMYFSLKPGVFGINGKLFENAREWFSFHADILNVFQVIQVSNLEIDIKNSDFECILLLS